jgi:hypothetical protein
VNKPQFRINLNGDTFESKADEFETLDDKLRGIEAAMSTFSVHGRNYQTCPDPAGALKADQEAFVAALRHLNAVRDWLDANRLHLEEQRRA